MPDEQCPPAAQGSQGGPLVSCIVIFLNAEKFLREAVESVLVQTYPNWELLLVDDGSTDRSTDTARQYTHRHPERVRYLEHERHQNRGMSASRNLGIRNSRGEYCAFLDADDVWLPHKLERQVAILESQPDAAMTWGPVGYWFSWTGNAADRQRDFVAAPAAAMDRIIRPPDLLGLCLNETPPAVPSSFLVRRQVLERIGGFEESFRGLFEDQALLAKVYLQEPVFVSRECLFRYRVHDGSNTFIAAKAGHYHAARWAFFRWLESYMRRQGINGSAAWRALRAAQWPYRHPFLSRIAKGGQVLRRWLDGFADRIMLAAVKVRARVINKRTGTLRAIPNPIPVSGRFSERFPPVGATTLSWRCEGVETLEVRVGAPHGPLLGGGGSRGSAATGHWVSHGMLFYLQDVSGGKALSRRNTLDMLRVELTASE